MATALQCAPWNSLSFDFNLDSADDTIMTSMTPVLDISLRAGIVIRDTVYT